MELFIQLLSIFPYVIQVTAFTRIISAYSMATYACLPNMTRKTTAAMHAATGAAARRGQTLEPRAGGREDGESALRWPCRARAGGAAAAGCRAWPYRTSCQQSTDVEA